MSSAPARHRRHGARQSDHGPARSVPVLVLAVLAVGVAIAAVTWSPWSPAVPVAVMGDSISAGTPQGGLGAANWTQLLGAERRWDVVNTSIGGTGYLNPGGAAPFEAAQLDEVVASRPEVVIVEGSPNDITLPVEKMSAAAGRLYRDLQARLPGVRVVAVGPFWNGTTSDDAMEWVDALAETARQSGVTWIDPMREGWFTGAYDPGRGLIGPDRVHPTDAGHALYARRLDADLTRLGL